MQARAIAHPNIALVKYWGKRDLARNLPAVGSISVTLADLSSEMEIELDSALARDSLQVNSVESRSMLARVTACLDKVAGSERCSARIRSRSNFPIAAGLASSASAFAALVVAADAAYATGCSREALINLAAQASGSAARSLSGGFVELKNQDDGVSVSQLLQAEEWPLGIVVAITAPGPKPLSSGDAMEVCRKTSPFYDRWVEQQSRDLAEAAAAIRDRDLARLGAVAEHNCLKMHSVMWGSRPPVVYWNSATVACMQTVRRLQADGAGAFFTIDAGPQVKVVCEPQYVTQVRDAMRATPGVSDVMVCGIGPGARLLDA